MRHMLLLVKLALPALECPPPFLYKKEENFGESLWDVKAFLSRKAKERVCKERKWKASEFEEHCLWAECSFHPTHPLQGRVSINCQGLQEDALRVWWRRMQKWRQGGLGGGGRNGESGHLEGVLRMNCVLTNSGATLLIFVIFGKIQTWVCIHF